MTSLSRVWMAAGVAVVNGHTDQAGYKLKSLLTSFRHGKKAFFTSDLRPLSGLLRSNVNVGDGKITQSDESLRQVMYFNSWAQN